jgi:branched-chain amino acid aminotransferase
MTQSTTEFICFNSQFISKNNLNQLIDKEALVVYEVIRLYHGQPLFWEAHWQRLMQSTSAIAQAEFIDRQKIESDLAELIARNAYRNTNIRIDVFDSRVLIYGVTALYPSKENYENGVKLNFTEAERVLPRLKIYRSKWRKKRDKEIESASVFETLLINKQGLITEASHSNVFFVRSNKIYTADEALILPGITRQMIMKVALSIGVEVVYAELKKTNISSFDAAFLSATSYNILPIAQIEQYSFDVQNKTLNQLRKAFKALLEEEKHKNIRAWKR